MNSIRFEEQGMLQRAREVHKQYNKSREAWRQGFLNGLGELGLQSGYQIASELQSNTWLADLAWLRSRKADFSDFDGLALACYVVWESPDDVLRKRLLQLALVRAEVRLFIFNANLPGRHNEVVEKAKLWLDFPMVSPGRILLISSGNSDRDIQWSFL
jgi:hypothetical protein